MASKPHDELSQVLQNFGSMAFAELANDFFMFFGETDLFAFFGETDLFAFFGETDLVERDLLGTFY